MNSDKQIASINQLSNDMDEIYHEIAQHFELTDNIYWIFYILHDNEKPVTQSDLSRKWAFSKKTVNSSIATMIKSDWITLELLPNSRKLKAINLTTSGDQLCQRVGNLTHQIEHLAYSELNDDEFVKFLKLFERLNINFRKAADELLTKDDSD
ncbi:MarR family winged helix-turn-helix transcriptional regulator [Companilactobacillus insicii]|uniref:MarR family winged helix-turn-helix transcriptional regulator n=1 Tax=Companilactobacillus insicii TaxID=1732567 RepID=UPI000F7A9C27|nr:MarR family transcriptional regulator [Companilactobacillus insicii]